MASPDQLAIQAFLGTVLARDGVSIGEWGLEWVVLVGRSRRGLGLA